MKARNTLMKRPQFLTPTVLTRALFFLINDFILSAFTLYFAYALRFNFAIPDQFLAIFPAVLLTLFGLKAVLFYYFRIYHTPWRFFALNAFEKLIIAHLIAYPLLAGIILLSDGALSPFPRSVLIIDLFLSIVVLGSLRISKRMILSSGKRLGHETVIIGANQRGELAVRLLNSQGSLYVPIAFVDKDPNVCDSYIHNLRVFHLHQLESLVQRSAIDTAIIADHYEPKALESLIHRLEALGVKRFKRVGFVDDAIEDIAIEDLLAREPKDLDKEAIGAFVKDKSVLVTGAGGSIGSELVRQLKRYGAKHLILVENSEFALYRILEEVGEEGVSPVLLSVVHKSALETVYKVHRPQIVLHAAAYKHVPMVEANKQSAFENNIQGTMNNIDLAIAYGVETFVLISTDKAVRPTNVMGATKRVCELYAQNVAPLKTRIVSVRFGNVLGSSGSVIPKFKAQIKQGGPITVTHPEITRYFMLISEACELVLQAASLAKAQEVFILDMGEPIKIADLAEKMKILSNRPDIAIEYVGLRAGEKLYEELMIDEDDKKTCYASIFIAPPTAYAIDKLKADIDALLKSEGDVECLKRIVPEFEHRRDN